MNLSELKQLVSYWLDDLDLAYFTPAQVTRFLNNAQKEVQKRLILSGENWYLKCAQTSLVQNQREYILPDDFLTVNRLEVVVSGTPPQESLAVILPITPQQQDLIPTQQGVPVGYFLNKGRFICFPAPDNTYTLRLYYQYKIADMVNDVDIPDVPDVYHEMIALLAAYDGLIKDTRDPSNVIKKIDEYDKLLKSTAAQRQVDKSRSVITTGTYPDLSSEWGWYY